MSLAIELPDEYSQSIESGEKKLTFQLQDKIRVGDVVNIFAGSAKRKVKITRKVWVPETQMDDRIRTELMGKVSAAEGYSGAYRLSMEYLDGASEGEGEGEDLLPKRFGEDADEIADLIDD